MSLVSSAAGTLQIELENDQAISRSLHLRVYRYSGGPLFQWNVNEPLICECIVFEGLAISTSGRAYLDPGLKDYAALAVILDRPR